MFILSVTAPIFILILLGFVAVRADYFSRDGLKALGRFVIAFAMPAMIFNSLSKSKIAELWHPDYLLTYGIGSIAAFAIGYSIAIMRRQTAQSGAVRALGMSLSNSAFVGFPIALQVFGPIASVAFALNLLIENLIILPIVFAILDAKPQTATTGGRLKAVLQPALSNPILIAAASGVLFAWMGLHLPLPVQTAMDLTARAATGVALIYIGGSLSFKLARQDAMDVGLVAFGKLLVHPALVTICAAATGILNTPLGHCAIAMSAAPMMSVYGVIGQKNNEQQMCSAALALATVAAFATMNVFLALLAAQSGGVIPTSP